MNHPLVSVLIPLYNHARFIVQCLDSILEDSYPNKEIIIIDDGSRDSSASLVRKWHSDHSSFPGHAFTFICRENRGLTKTLNELVGLAQGELIAVLASDDYLLAGGIAYRAAYLESHHDKLAVFGDCRLVDYDGNVSHKSGLSDLHNGRKNHLNNSRLISYEIVFNWCVPGPVFMARKGVYQLLGGYNEDIVVEDWDFYLRLVSRNLLGFIDYPVAAYRIRPDEGPKEINTQHLIRFNDAMLKTVTNHLHSFKGIRRAYLVAEQLKFHGILERLKGNRSIRAFLCRKAGRILENALKAAYNTWGGIFLFTLRINGSLHR
ncbi:MAG TPA: glycosyltransferase [Desulfuromonadaceae bacterium]|jgi:glycosyltransferase involved in cell wall biosynthesis